MADNAKLVGPVFMGVGTLFAAVGLYFVIDTFRFTDKAYRAMGEVISFSVIHSTDSDGRRSTTYMPTFRYTAANGKVYEGETHLSSSGYDFPVGTRKEILYDPADLTEVRINNFWSLWTFPLAFALGGLLFVVIGAFVFFRRIRPASDDSTIRRNR